MTDNEHAALRADLAKPLREDTMTNRHVASRFEMKDTAVERVAKALFFENYKEVDALDRTETTRLWTSYLAFMECEGYEPQDYFERAAAAIAAHTAYLRERAQDNDVVEAVMYAITAGFVDAAVRRDAKYALTAALDAMLGKENHNDQG